MRPTIRWKPTKIGGQVGKDDFYAYVYGVGVGRVHTEIHPGPVRPKIVWSWSFMCGHGDFAKGNHAYEDEKQAAADRVRERFDLFIITPPEDGGGMGYEPEEFPPDASSQVLHKLKVRDPDAFRKRIEDIRAGRIDRNYHRWVHDDTPLQALTEDDYYPERNRR